MRVKFTHHERVAGVFVLSALVGAVALTIGTGIKRGWFDSKIDLICVFKRAEGIYPGTPVQMAGLRAGVIDEVELTADNQVRVRFLLKSEFFKRVKSDSQVQIVRPFVIGEKMLDVSLGSPSASKLKAGSELATVESLDLMDMVSGKSLGSGLASLAKSAESLRKVFEAFTDRDRTSALIETFDLLKPLVADAHAITSELARSSRQWSKRHSLENLVDNAALLTSELNKILPQLNQTAPNFGQDLGRMSQQIAALTEELAKLTPLLKSLASFAPQMPEAGGRALEALDETVVTLKAIQRSFLLRGSTREVREEESQAKKLRAPAQNGAQDKQDK